MAPLMQAGVRTAVLALAASAACAQSVVFREERQYFDTIPGWDHIAFEVSAEQVWECHPGYDYAGSFPFVPPGTAWDPDRNERRIVPNVHRVQSYHSLGSFRHNSAFVAPNPAPTRDFSRLMISPSLASAMEFVAVQHAGVPYPPIGIGFIPNLLSPELQKGASILGSTPSFTCCGFVEFCAEEAGYRGGHGFIPDYLESITARIGGVPVPISTLSPALLHVAISQDWRPLDLRRLLRGVFDPVDFVITDPQGRRVGHTGATGTLNEVPGIVYTGNGDYEQLIWTDPPPGLYRIELTGVGAEAMAAIDTGSAEGFAFRGFLAPGQTVGGTFRVDGPCAAEFDDAPGVTVADIFAYLAAWFAGDARADVDGHAGVSVADIFVFLAAWFAGCG